jgi:hypothetical protein
MRVGEKKRRRGRRGESKGEYGPGVPMMEAEEERGSPQRNRDESARGGERVRAATRNGRGENKVNRVLAQKMRTPYGLTIGITSQNWQ